MPLLESMLLSVVVDSNNDIQISKKNTILKK